MMKWTEPSPKTKLAPAPPACWLPKLTSETLEPVGAVLGCPFVSQLFRGAFWSMMRKSAPIAWMLPQLLPTIPAHSGKATLPKAMGLTVAEHVTSPIITVLLVPSVMDAILLTVVVSLLLAMKNGPDWLKGTTFALQPQP